jgi:hypothetical protein
MDNDQSMPTNATPTPEIPKLEFDFESVYANNARFEPSVWDLKFLFGELEQHTGREVVTFHTAVTMPWLQVKLLSYYVRLNLAIHELNGKIAVPPSLTPPLPEPPTPEQSQADPMRKQVYDIVAATRAEMFG